MLRAWWRRTLGGDQPASSASNDFTRAHPPSAAPMQVGPVRARHAEPAGLGSSLDPQIPEAERSSATRGNGRAEPSDGGCMSRSSAMVALVMIGTALALTSCAGGKAGDRSDVAGWRHRDGSAVSDLEFGQARVLRVVKRRRCRTPMTAFDGALLLFAAAAAIWLAGRCARRSRQERAEQFHT